MSMRSWSIDGIGICTDNKSKDTLREIVAGHIDSACKFVNEPEELLEVINDSEKLCEYLDEHESYHSGITGAFGIVADIISEEEGITIEYHRGEYEEAIMMSAGMPWQFNEKELLMTEDKLVDIFNRYFNSDDAGYVSVEYYG